MRAAVYDGPRSIKVTGRPDPVIAAPTDDLDHVAQAYEAMDQRRAIKALIRIDTKGTGR